jgi:hypothetical protein
MTTPAKITQADMERAAKAVKSAGYECARIIIDLPRQRIEVVLGDAAAAVADPDVADWSNDDV